MKKYHKQGIVFILSFCLLSNIFAQEIDSDVTDKFDSIRTITTTYVPLEKQLGVNMVAVKGLEFLKGSIINYALAFKFQAPYVCSVDKESYVQVILENGNNIKLAYSGRYEIFSGGQTVALLITITNYERTLLAESPVTDVRISMNKFQYDISVKSKLKNNLINVCKLIE